MIRTKYRYGRISTGRQNLGRYAQRPALETAGCTEGVEEQASGRKARPTLAELVDRLAPGDAVTVFWFDRISRLVAAVYGTGARTAWLCSTTEQFDTSTPMGHAMVGSACIG